MAENLAKRLMQLAQELKPAAVDFAQRLIRVPALSGDEKAISELYLQEFRRLGYDGYFRDDWGNIVALMKGNAPGPTIMYNGHLDHVDPGDISEWQGYDPYGGEIDVSEVYDQDMTQLEKTGVIHGRAAADVKCGCACMVYAGYGLKKLREAGETVPGCFLFTVTVLEEPGEQLGMIKLCEDTLSSHNINFGAVVSCEATSLKLYLGHRGRVELNVKVSGVTSHGSAPWLGVNAVNKSTRLIDAIEETVKEESIKDPHVGFSSIALTNIRCTPGAMCIVPDRCYLTYDRRYVPGEDVDGCVCQIQRIIDDIKKDDPNFRAEVSIAVSERTTYTGKSIAVANMKQTWKLDKEHAVTLACKQALEEVGQTVKYGYWDFGTDLSYVSGKLCKPCIGYSPMQEYYCHRPVDQCRLDYMEKALAGYLSIQYNLSRLDESVFQV